MGLGSVLKKKSMEYLEWWVIHSMITRLGDKRIGTTKNIFFDNLARGDNLKSIKLEIVSCAWNTTQVSGINIQYPIYIYFSYTKIPAEKNVRYHSFLFIVFFFPAFGNGWSYYYFRVRIYVIDCTNKALDVRNTEKPRAPLKRWVKFVFSFLGMCYRWLNWPTKPTGIWLWLFNTTTSFRTSERSMQKKYRSSSERKNKNKKYIL